MKQTLSARRVFLTSMLAAPALAQDYVPKQSDRPERLSGDEPGFVPIFDGKSLHGWEGDPKYWRVENGCMVGEITPETVIRSNTFIVWQGGSPIDFELKVDFRITQAGNSGINYRSVVIPDRVTPTNKFAMRGYQFDIDGQNRYTGNNYEEKGRLFLAERGQITRVSGKRIPVVLSVVGSSKDLAARISSEWNSVHLMIRGNVLVHSLNGQMMCMVMDDDPARPKDGRIGVQVHVGPPMKVEYRNWRIRTL